MPIINDSTVLASAYATSASARPQRLSNGWIVTCVKTTGDGLLLSVSKDNAVTWQNLCYKSNGGASITFSLCSRNNTVYLLLSSSLGSTKVCPIDAETIGYIDISFIGTIISSGQNNNGDGCSICIDDTKTELHVAWCDKTTTYPSYFNIRYAKVTINTVNGSVTVGTVEQVGTLITIDNINPSIVFNGSLPIIISEISALSGTNKSIVCNRKNGASWFGNNNVYLGSNYAQSSPSAIFVPKSINGLVNGRIHCEWHGTDSVDTTKANIRYSYSDDGGVTWSAMDKRTSGNTIDRKNVSVTANKLNEIFSEYEDGTGISQMKNTGGVWGSATTKVVTGTLPSTLYDPTFNFMEPLLMYKGAAKVGFYGSWTVTSINITQGSIGAKSDKANLLTYAITTDGTMSAITEKVNGVSVGTKTLASGSSTPVGLTQAQWDAIKYGKYGNYIASTQIASSLAINWEQGNLANTSKGNTITPNATNYEIRLITPINVVGGETYTFKLNSLYRTRVVQTNNSNVITVTPTQNYYNGESIIFESDTTKLFLYVSKVDSSTIIPSDIVTASITVATLTKTSDNTLTVSMGTDTFTYTFDKRLSPTDDIISAMKAVQDSQSVMLPSIKAKFGEVIRSKGGSVNDSDSFDTMVDVVETSANKGNKKWATGYFTDNNIINTLNLTFTPSIVLWGTDNINSNAQMGAYTDMIGSFKTYGKDIKPNIIYDTWSSSSDYGNIGIAYKFYNALSISANQIKIRGFNGGSVVRWVVIE
jgi:hypothetical protein